MTHHTPAEIPLLLGFYGLVYMTFRKMMSISYPAKEPMSSTTNSSLEVSHFPTSGSSGLTVPIAATISFFTAAKSI